MTTGTVITTVTLTRSTCTGNTPRVCGRGVFRVLVPLALIGKIGDWSRSTGTSTCAGVGLSRAS
jgi:hypothetical protein